MRSSAAHFAELSQTSSGTSRSLPAYSLAAEKRNVVLQSPILAFVRGVVNFPDDQLSFTTHGRKRRGQCGDMVCSAYSGRAVRCSELVASCTQFLQARARVSYLYARTAADALKRARECERAADVAFRSTAALRYDILNSFHCGYVAACASDCCSNVVKPAMYLYS
eukprot:IDg12418t1